MWFCSSGFGPGPSVGIAPAHLPERVGRPEHQQEEERRRRRTASRAPSRRAGRSRRRAEVARRRPRCSRRGSSAHSRIEPSSALHSAAKLNSGGVVVDADLGDVGEREVAGDQRPLHRRRRRARAPSEHDADVDAARCASEVRLVAHEADDEVMIAEQRRAEAEARRPAMPSAAFTAASGVGGHPVRGSAPCTRSVCFTRIRSPAKMPSVPMRPSTTTGMPSLKMPPGLALVVHRDGGAVEGDGEVDVSASSLDRARYRRCPGRGSACPAMQSAALADLVGVAEVHRGVRQALEEDDRRRRRAPARARWPPASAVARRRRAGCGGGRARSGVA